MGFTVSLVEERSYGDGTGSSPVQWVVENSIASSQRGGVGSSPS